MVSQLKHRRTHNLLLLSKILSCRENASPFTLVVDSLEQSGKAVVREMIKRAKSCKVKVIYLSFETLRPPSHVDVLLYGNDFQLDALKRRVVTSLDQTTRSLLVFDTLHCLLSLQNFNLPSFLSFFMSPKTSILALYHADVPVALAGRPLYSPHPITLLNYLATTVLTLHSVAHVLSQQKARDRSRPEPVFGLKEETEGALLGLGSNDRSGLVIEMEYRRKSGRGVREWFFLPSPNAATTSSTTGTLPQRPKERITLLEDHPQYSLAPAGEREESEDREDATFSTELTEKQRRDREGVVLPYFDAQRDEGPGEGGRILYDMGAEDDFDEEEDEI